MVVNQNPLKFTAVASIQGTEFDERAVRDVELARARHSLAYAMHRSPDAHNGMQMRLRKVRPDVMPYAVVKRHLTHLSIEFTNWTREAWLETPADGTAR